jgi:cell wall-associated NlpC family hydrolase
MHWTVGYLGKPWSPGANGPDAYDCWGLIRAVLKDRGGIDIPAAPVARERDSLRAVLTAFRDSPLYQLWRPVDRPEALDVALMAEGRHPVHVGVWVPEGRGRVLHATQGMGVVCMDLPTLEFNGFRVLGWYRHADRF